MKLVDLEDEISWKDANEWWNQQYSSIDWIGWQFANCT